MKARYLRILGWAAALLAVTAAVAVSRKVPEWKSPARLDAAFRERVLPRVMAGDQAAAERAYAGFRQEATQGAEAADEARQRVLAGENQGFRFLFSGAPFPGHTHRMEWGRAEEGGHWYYGPPNFGVQGWLGPAFFKYLRTTPRFIYFKAEPK